jgi:hypothetical protein
MERTTQTSEPVIGNDAVIVAPIMERDGHPPKPRPCYFITDQLLLLWPPVYRFSPPPTGGERWNGGNLRHLSRKISGQHARMHRVIWNIVEGPQQPPYCFSGEQQKPGLKGRI